ncbi:hypothetical protein P7C73_g1156, partial [Tremellales sp. Uapishka_1]
MSLPLAVVVGAIGTQGRCEIANQADSAGHSVSIALAKSGQFRVRSLTRNIESPKALELGGLPNVTVHYFDANKAETVESAFTDADYVFAMTAEGQDETTQGKLMVDTAKKAGVKFFIFSSLPDPAPYDIPFFKKKQAVSQYLNSSQLPGCSIYLPFFMENFLDLGQITVDDSQKVHLKFVRIAVDKESYHVAINPDLGNAVLRILQHVRSGKSAPELNHKDLILGDRSGRGSISDIAGIIERKMGLSTEITVQPIFEPEGGEYDELFAKNAGSRDAGFFENDIVPSAELRELGLTFTSLKDYVENTVIPSLSTPANDKLKPIGTSSLS